MNKKIIGILIVCLFIGTCVLPLINGEESDYYLLQKNVDYKLSKLEASTQNNIKVNSNKNTDISNSEQTNHTVLAEYGTATWCPYCVFAHGALKALYQENQNFYYVTLVTDKNTKAQDRVIEYNVYGFPTIWWDGGYNVDVGAGSVPSAKSAYYTSIYLSGLREVKDVGIALSSLWLCGTKMKINVNITNYESSTYNGTIRVYITEKISSMGWKDKSGQLYTFPFLDWAFNEAISIPAGGSWNNSVTWDGSSHGYPTVTQNNTKIIAAIFNDKKHKGYSYPPKGNPFDAYYVDKTVATEPVEKNNLPNTPTITGQTSGKINIVYTYNTTTTDFDNDQVYYWFDWGDGTNSNWLGPYQSAEVCEANHNWTEKGNYEIKVKARDIYGCESEWSNPLNMTISKNKAIGLTKLSWLFDILHQYFPLLEKILNLYNN